MMENKINPHNVLWVGVSRWTGATTGQPVWIHMFFFFVELSRWAMCRMWFGCVLSKSAKTYLKETSSEWLCMFVPNLNRHMQKESFYRTLCRSVKKRSSYIPSAFVGSSLLVWSNQLSRCGCLQPQFGAFNYFFEPFFFQGGMIV